MIKKIKISTKKDFYFLFTIINIYFWPSFFFGNNVIEDYYLNHFSLLISSKNFFSPFLFYYDLIGPGARMPLGAGLNYFFPSSLLINNFGIFYYFTLLICFYLQLNFLKKVLKLYSIAHYNYVLIFFFIFSTEFLFQIYLSDSIKTIFLYSCLPAVFYFCTKFFLSQNNKYFYRLILILSYLIVNGHILYGGYFILFLIIYTLLNNHYFFLKKKYFYYSVALFLVIISEETYRIFYEFASSNDLSNRAKVFDYDLKHFFSGIVFFLKFLEDVFKINLPFFSEFKWLDNFLLPFGGIIFYFAFFESIRTIIKKNSKSIFFIDFLFLILIFITLLDIHNYIPALNSLFLLRDFFNFLSIILFGRFILSIQNKQLATIILSISLLISVLHIFQTINYKYKTYIPNSYNYLKENKNFESLELHNFLKKMKNNEFKKTYLSNKVWNIFDGDEVGAIGLNQGIINENEFFNINIFFFNDFLKYEIFPFNLRLKNANQDLLRNSENKMYSAIEPKIDEINNEFFFNIFNIGYLLVFEDELSKIKSSKFKTLKKIKFNNQQLYFLELNDLSKKVVLINKKFENKKFKNCINNKNDTQIRCLILNSNNNFKKSSEIIVSRISTNNYKIVNKSNKHQNFVLPFLYDKSWRAKGKKMQNLNKAIMFVKIEPNSEEVIFYRDYVRLLLKALSIISFIIIITISFNIKKKN